MPIFAYTAEVASFFTSLLHDLQFEVPQEGFTISDTRIKLRLTDQHGYLSKERVSEFDLTVHNVLRVEVDGDPKNGLGNDMLNEIKFDKKNSIVALTCCMAIKKIECHVSKLHLELNQLA
ncbi:MAG: hypothetical protein ACRD2Q_12160 [Terriglobales bacterium]